MLSQRKIRLSEHGRPLLISDRGIHLSSVNSYAAILSVNEGIGLTPTSSRIVWGQRHK
jgi:hypothetical protein